MQTPSFKGRRALVVSPVATHPTTHGNRARVVAMIGFLEALGFEVHVVILLRGDADTAAMQQAYGDRLHLVPYTRPPRRETATGAWVRRVRQIADQDARYMVGGDDWYDDATDAVMDRLDRDVGFDLAVVEYAFLSRALLRLKSPTLKVIDTHDIFANRHRVFLKAGLTPSYYSTTPDEEKRCLARADLVLGIQAHETGQLLAYGLDAITFGHTVEIDPIFDTAAAQFDLLMVGSGNPMNVEGLLWFGQQVLPHLAASAPGLRIAVAGGVCSATPEFAGLTKLGIVQDLKHVYARSRMAMNPVRNGTGLNIKSVEAMGFGMPLLSTPSGSRGLEDAWGTAIVVSDLPEAFAQAALALAGDGPALSSLSQGGLAFARQWNSLHTEVFRSRLAAAFAPLS